MQPAAAQLASLQLHTAGFEGVEIRRTRTPLPYACRSDAGRWGACSATIEGTLFSFSGILWPFLFSIAVPAALHVAQPAAQPVVKRAPDYDEYRMYALK